MALARQWRRTPYPTILGRYFFGVDSDRLVLSVEVVSPRVVAGNLCHLTTLEFEEECISMRGSYGSDFGPRATL